MVAVAEAGPNPEAAPAAAANQTAPPWPAFGPAAAQMDYKQLLLGP